jgi:antitoxin ParD1/3/4
MKESPPGNAMPTRNVVLTDRQAKFVEKMVASGRYQNASEVMREGLRLVEQQEAENAAKLKALREAVQLGIDDIEAGRYRIFENGDGLEAHLKAVASAALNRKRG